MKVKGKYVQYWFTGTGQVHAEQEMMPLGQIGLRQLKMDFLHDPISEVMEPLNGCGSTIFKVIESRRRKRAAFR